MVENINSKESEQKAAVIGVRGDHNEVWEKGTEVARCVATAILNLKISGYLRVHELSSFS